MYRSPAGLRRQDTEGGGRNELIAGTSEVDYPGSLTPDGETLVFLRSSQESVRYLHAPASRSGTARPLLSTSAYEGGARLSPDGRWLPSIVK